MNILTSSENNQPFYSIAGFFVRFTTLSERNVSLQEQNSNVSSRRIGVKCFHFKILMMCQSICFSRRDSFGSFAHCWSHTLTLYFVVFKIIFVVFLKRSWWCNFHRKKKRGLPHRLRVAFHNGLHRGADVRTVWQWRHNQKQTPSWVFPGGVYQNLLSMGLRARPPSARAELR